MTRRQVEQRAAAVLREAGVTEFPVDVEAVARRRGLDVVPYDLGDGVSGALFVDGDAATIGYNPSDPPVRRRFTVAHELGHYELHARTAPLFVDRSFAVAYRDGRSSTGEVRREREANAFAAALLMPASAIHEAVQDLEFDLASEDETAVRELARRFGVSSQAMMFRIMNLGLSGRSAAP